MCATKVDRIYNTLKIIKIITIKQLIDFNSCHSEAIIFVLTITIFFLKDLVGNSISIAV